MATLWIKFPIYSEQSNCYLNLNQKTYKNEYLKIYNIYKCKC